MDNNDWSNQNNFNNQVNDTNVNNQGDLYNNNMMNQVEISKKKINVKLFIIIFVIVIVVGLVLKLFGIGTKYNTTGSTDYKGSDVDYNCISEYTSDDKTTKVYSDFIFNYKSFENDGKEYNYQLKVYRKMIVEYKNGLTDSRYKDFVDSFDAVECLSSVNKDKCTASHIELAMAGLGWDIVVDRIGDRIEVTYYNIYGMGTTATKKDMKEIIEQYESNGYICK